MPVFLVVENGRNSRVSINERLIPRPVSLTENVGVPFSRLARFDRERAAFVSHCFERVEHEVFDYFFDSDRVSECVQARRQSRDDRVFAARWLSRHGEHSLNDGYEIDVSWVACVRR